MTLAAVIDLLACPICGGGLVMGEGWVGCHAGHRFDLARQGYVTLSRAGIRHPGDTADMVAARERVLSSGLLDSVAQAGVDAVPDAARTVLDVGAGTGHHTAAVVQAHPERRGVALDSSKAALRRAARAHPRVGAVGADLVEGLPVADGCIDAVLVTFAPRNVAEFDRVLAPGGSVVVITPGVGHLSELVGPLGMLGVAEDKAERLEASLSASFDLTRRVAVREGLTVTPTRAADLAQMGPAGFHATTADFVERAQHHLQPTTQVTLDVEVSTFQRPG